MFLLSKKSHVLVEGGRNVSILAGIPWLTSGNGKICHSWIFSDNMWMNITGTKEYNRYMNTTFSQLYKIRPDVMEKPIHQCWGQGNLDNQKTKCLWKCSLFLNLNKSPIKSTLCGKGAHNHRTCPNVAPSSKPFI